MGEAHHRAVELLILGLERRDGLAEAGCQVICLLLNFRPLSLEVGYNSLQHEESNFSCCCGATFCSLTCGLPPKPCEAATSGVGTNIPCTTSLWHRTYMYMHLHQVKHQRSTETGNASQHTMATSNLASLPLAAKTASFLMDTRTAALSSAAARSRFSRASSRRHSLRHRSPELWFSKRSTWHGRRPQEPTTCPWSALHTCCSLKNPHNKS